MKILLLGKNGQLGWELQRALAPLGTLVALDRHEGGDLADSAALAATVKRVAPDVIVNAAAYTAVDKAESDVEAAQQINAAAAGVLAREAKALGALLVHYSTDYVFDGSGELPRNEDAATGPLSVYGRTKLEGEQLIQASGADALVLRTSWVYAARGGNFAKTMLRLAAERDQLKVVADQIGAPTGADLLADLTAHLVRATWADRSLAGVYHAVASGETSWHAYAQHVLRRAVAKGVVLKVAPDQVQAIPTSAYPVPAPRPLNSRLDNGRLQQRFGLVLPQWQAGVDRMLDEIL
ncbi:dTDP-4-dehydrorhamnose reductase [Roseateles sp. YR242]|uniref:dTDP-4-dehydrorhamnose reductase n=1 Tax=Roseateles sp. YR242 TaxID=1855305 RepID=UPI0008BE8CF5|nr:dTDP-4-dehydrorhamnose reductase [Roseateles sp. YR242]SEK52106.1 dTDP-4-dehydrorhamnose reductase [Roseateles sp. YR242]